MIIRKISGDSTYILPAILNIPTAHSFNFMPGLLAKYLESHTSITVPAISGFFSNLKLPLKGRRFLTLSEIKNNLTKHLIVIPKEDLADYFEK